MAIDLCNLYVLHFTVCKDSKHCRLYNASRICITNGIYYEWSQKHCPAYCGYCQGSYSSFKIGTFILRLDSTQRPEKWSSSFFVTHFSRDIYLREEKKNNVLLFFKKLCTFIVLFWVLYSMFQSWIKIVGVENVTYEQIHHRINKHLWFYSIYTDQVVNVVNIFR